MISFKVLIILTFTINLSHCKYSKEQIQNECKICGECLKATGFRYKLIIINYNFAKKCELIGTEMGKNFFELQTTHKLEFNASEKLHSKAYGLSLLSKADINNFITAYYNEIINERPEITPMSLNDYCEERFNQLNSYTNCTYNKIGITTIIETTPQLFHLN
ncbi:uncharacterized protein LOC112603748 isoform X2 [Melanaphis sacchari]|uniref:uncharacterized protein LOC112603748 isoform X2 n=1 Tax=Melanaphis sacchari TaxID=742174 RepID=UPI000DC149F2|nr:uncharacterized protein LOC112603748 isoform X2 [Melanaphis sacchari]